MDARFGGLERLENPVIPFAVRAGPQRLPAGPNRRAYADRKAGFRRRAFEEDANEFHERTEARRPDTGVSNELLSLAARKRRTAYERCAGQLRHSIPVKKRTLSVMGRKTLFLSSLFPQLDEGFLDIGMFPRRQVEILENELDERMDAKRESYRYPAVRIIEGNVGRWMELGCVAGRIIETDGRLQEDIVRRIFGFGNPIERKNRFFNLLADFMSADPKRAREVKKPVSRDSIIIVSKCDLNDSAIVHQAEIISVF